MKWLRKFFPLTPQQQAARDLEQLVKATREKNRSWAFARLAQLNGERRERFERAMGL